MATPGDEVSDVGVHLDRVIVNNGGYLGLIVGEGGYEVNATPHSPRGNGVGDGVVVGKNEVPPRFGEGL